MNEAVYEIEKKFEERMRKMLNDLLLEVSITLVDIENAGGGPDDLKHLYDITDRVIREKLTCLSKEET